MGRATSRLVGRRRELRAIDAALGEVLDGRSSCIALVGEPGIGKTRLILEACRRAEQAGVAVIEGRGTEFEREIPFGIVVDSLDRPLARRDPAWLEGLSKARLAELGTVLPSLAADARGGLATMLTAERYRCYDAVRAVLDQLASEGPLLVALDDLHWADDASLELIAHLFRRRPAHPFAAIVAYRARQAAPRLLEAVARAERDAGLTAFELAPLSENEARELLVASADGTAVQALHRESGGNPFYLTELARTSRSAGRAGSGQPMEGEDVPAAVQAAIAQEMDEASPAAAALLRAAAVAGEPFEVDLIAEIAGMTEQEALTPLDELLGLQLVRPSGIPGRYAFRHPITRSAVYVFSGSGFRLAAHAKAAEALRRRGAGLSAIAHHVERSARPGDMQAAELLASAAKAAEARAPGAAARWYDGALRLLPGSAPREQRFALLTARGLALGATGKVLESSAALTSALTLLRSDETLSRARLAGALSRLEHMAGEHGRAHQLMLDSLADLGDKDAVASTALQVELAADCGWGNDISGMAAFALAARERAREHGEPVLHGYSAALLALAQCYMGQTAEAAASADLAAVLIDQLPDTELASRVEAFAVLGYAELGLERLAESARHAQRGIAICRGTGQSPWFVLLLTVLGAVQGWRGRLREAWDAAEAATASARLEHPLPQVQALSIRCWIQIQRGDLHSAIATGREAVTIGAQAPEALLSWRAQTNLALAEIESGEPARGRDRILAETGGGNLTAVEPNWRPRWYEILSGAELALGDVDTAARWAERAEEAAASYDLPGRQGEAKRAGAAVELARGDARSCAELAGQAAERFSAVGRRIDAGRAWILEAQAHAELDDRERALQLLRRAHSEMEDCGARRYKAAAARELRRLGRPVPASAGRELDDDGPLAALSRREREVADLVARGMRNRQIAEELVLSPKTVETHLAHIFEKLGVSSRVHVVRLVQQAHGDPGVHD